MKVSLLLTNKLRKNSRLNGFFIGTKDAEYLQLEKQFNEFAKLSEVLAKDAGIFRDSIAGKENYSSRKRKKNTYH